MVSNDEMQNLEKNLSKMVFENWIHYDLFTWKWWLLLGLAIIPWVIWWKIVDKNRVHRILLFGFFVSLTATFLDVYGWSRHAWVYPINLLPMRIPLLPFDLTIVPVAHMLVYQYFRSWKSFILAEIVASLFFAFIAEPFLVWAGIYKMINWKYSYSIPFYIGKSFLGRWLVEKMEKPKSVAR